MAQAARDLLDSLVTNAPPRDRDVEASKARAVGNALSALGEARQRRAAEVSDTRPGNHHAPGPALPNLERTVRGLSEIEQREHLTRQ